MPGTEFKILFTGTLAEGTNGGDVLKNLCALFKAEPGKIKGLFSRKGAVVWRGRDRAVATRLMAALEKAGAVCRMEESTGMQPPDPTQDGDVTPHGKEDAGNEDQAGTDLSSCTGEDEVRSGIVPGASPEPTGKEGAGMGGQLHAGIVPKSGGLDMSLTPVTCFRISAVPNGLGTGRKDCTVVAFDELLLASAFKCSDKTEDYRLLLFTARQRRPLVADCSAIAYNEFSSATENSMVSSLRTFLTYLHTMQPGLVFDVDTRSFIDGASPRLYTKDITVLATALYQASEMPAAALPRKCSRPAEPAALAGSQGAAPVAPFYVRGGNISPAKELDAWSERLSLVFAMLLMAGFAWPLLKRSMLFGSDQLIWFWQLMGMGLDAEKAASMGTISSGDALLPWALIPLGTALLTLAIRSTFSGGRRSLGFLIVGAVSTALLFAVYYKEAELYGLMIIPPTMAGGILVLLTVFCGGFIPATNHIRKTVPAGRLLRTLSGVGGMVVLLATLLAVFGSGWGGWGIYPLYGLMVLAGVLGVRHALNAEPDEGSLNLVTIVVRALLAWVPIAAIVTQSQSDSPFVQYAMSAGGGTANLAMSVLKSFAIYYGCAFIMVLGLTGMLAALMPPPADKGR